jgi:hypothetical protein
LKTKLFGWFFGVLIAAAGLAGCASLPPRVARGSSNYLEKGMISERTKGGEFYMAIGQVDVYRYNFLGNPVPSGKTVDLAVVIQADKDSGQVQRIATLQPRNPDDSGSPLNYENGVTLNGDSPYILGDLRGGISITDIQAYPRWLDALNAMRKAIADLGTYTNYDLDERHYLVAVEPEPRVDFLFGFWWPHYYGYHHRYHHF